MVSSVTGIFVLTMKIKGFFFRLTTFYLENFKYMYQIMALLLLKHSRILGEIHVPGISYLKKSFLGKMILKIVIFNHQLDKILSLI